MLRTTFIAGASTLLLALPAMAQSSMSSGSSSNGMSNGTMSNGQMSTTDTSSITCDQMMAKEQSMAANGTGAKLTVAQNETAMANKARSAGNEAGCKIHMMSAMNALK